MNCHCGSSESFESCCGPYLKGERWPSTAEALMRARYTAYATGDIDFVIRSHHPKTAESVDRQATETWSKSAEWLGLEILATEFGGANDEAGFVDFLARYKMRGVTVPHRERAQFEKHEGKWYFVDGKEIKSPPLRHEGPRTGRNDPCPCGSGKKYKKCCGKDLS